MPQISKIRIVNFQYNDGNRLIADELYNFEGENNKPSDVLINLANGGGKSVLVQLMMQPIIPKAKVAGRRIESFFKKSTDHCYVAIEWVLDGSKNRLMTGIAMAASDSSTDFLTEADRGFQIKYYTFISSYQNDDEKYAAKNLPLSRKENGRFIPASFDDVRNLAKKSGGYLERYSSDDGVKWKEKLSQYGIIQDEWRVIEELNSNEDGLSKYFGNLKTSDAVIDKLIIPRIEGKYGSATRGEDCSLQTMLLSYAAQYSRQQAVVDEREVLSGFSAMLAEAKTQAEGLWKSKDSLEKSIAQLFAYFDALNAEITNQEKKNEQLGTKKNELHEDIRHIQWEKASYEYYSREEELEREKAAYDLAKEQEKKTEKALEEAKNKLLLLECARCFGKLKELENQTAAIDAAISNRVNSCESAGKLASLKYSAYIAIKAELERIVPQINALSEEKAIAESTIESLTEEIAKLQQEICKAKTEADKAEALLEKQRRDNDGAIEKLEIGAFRMLDGAYRENDLKEWQTAKQNEEKSVCEEIEKLKSETERLENRKEEIPQLVADKNVECKSLSTELDSVNERLSEFHSKEASLKLVCEKYGLDFSARFGDNAANYLNEQKYGIDGRISDIARKIDTTNEAIEATERGTLHIPKMLSNFLNGSGLHYVSVEKYLLDNRKNGILSDDSCADFLGSYPYAAYGVIIDSEADKNELYSESEGCWLPAVLPVFTREEIEGMLQKNAAPFACVAAYSKDYFRDSASYADNLRNALNQQHSQKQMLEECKSSLEADADTVTAFSAYDEGWEKKSVVEKVRLEKAIDEIQKQLKALADEQTSIKESIRDKKERERRLTGKLSKIQNQLSDFDKLLDGLKEETSFEKNQSESRRRYNDFAERRSRKCSEKDKFCGQHQSICDKLNELKKGEQDLHSGLETVSGVVPAEIVSGEWSSLVAQYKTLLSAQNEDLKRLNDDKARLHKEMDEWRKEIQKRNCSREDYESLFYSEELAEKATAEAKKAETGHRAAVDAFESASRSYGQAESSFRNSTERLKEFGNEPLPRNEVGMAFDERIADINAQIADIEVNLKLTDKALLSLQKLQLKAEICAEKYARPAKYDYITLNDNCEEQLASITSQIHRWENSVDTGARQIDENLKRMSEAYGRRSENVNRAVRSMRELLNGKVSGDKYYTLFDHIDTNMHAAELRISQIDTDLAEFHKTKDDLVRQCIIQGRQLYEGLKRLSGSSKVKVQDKRRQMLRFDIPEQVDENIAKAAITAEIDKGTEEIITKMADDTYSESEKTRTADRTVGSRNLLRKYIGTENITLRAYKIDRNPDNSGYRTWEQTQVNNSGAEKFVVYFAVILALMAYTRDDYDSPIENNNRSVLVLDNPFGPISSKHVLEPMFEISRNYKVQMICLSDISKSDIVSCFNLVIRAVVKKFALSSKEQLTHEGNESIEHGYYCSEQLNLFC